VTATNIEVVGGVSGSGGASLSPAPVTGAGPAPDPLAGLLAPPAGTAETFVNLGGSSLLTINPGVYSSIAIGGNAHLIMNPGIYEIDGGGFIVVAGGQVTGSAVLIYNAPSSYPSARRTLGSVIITGAASVQLTAPSTGKDAGIVFIQPPANAQTISIGGSAVARFGGTVYAPAATVSVTGSARFVQDALVANELQLQGSGTTTGATLGPATAAAAASALTAAITAGPEPELTSLAPATTGSSPATSSPSVMPTSRRGAASPAATGVVVSYRAAQGSPANGSEDDDTSSYLETDALADVALSLVRDFGDGVRHGASGALLGT
jgi:hypothetical protein